MQQIQGNCGVDDNFLVAAGSPTIDAGNAATLVGLCSTPNGGRINLGNFGGTAQATTSPQQQTLQVLTPSPLSKLEQGQQINLTWETNGLYAPEQLLLRHHPERPAAMAYYRWSSDDDLGHDRCGPIQQRPGRHLYVGGVQLGCSRRTAL